MPFSMYRMGHQANKFRIRPRIWIHTPLVTYFPRMSQLIPEQDS